MQNKTNVTPEKEKDIKKYRLDGIAKKTGSDIKLKDGILENY